MTLLAFKALLLMCYFLRGVVDVYGEGGFGVEEAADGDGGERVVQFQRGFEEGLRGEVEVSVGEGELKGYRIDGGRRHAWKIL